MIRLFGKSPFKGKTYNEVLTANKLCNLHFTDNIYYKIPKTGLFVFYYLFNNLSFKFTCKYAA